jgi:hypothetical protein
VGTILEGVGVAKKGVDVRYKRDFDEDESLFVLGLAVGAIPRATEDGGITTKSR